MFHYVSAKNTPSLIDRYKCSSTNIYVIYNIKCFLKESSVILLVSHRAQSLHPYCTNWFENIHDLVHKYFKYGVILRYMISIANVLC